MSWLAIVFVTKGRAADAFCENFSLRLVAHPGQPTELKRHLVLKLSFYDLFLHKPDKAYTLLMARFFPLLFLLLLRPHLLFQSFRIIGGHPLPVRNADNFSTGSSTLALDSAD
jgi:hypothetical protein